MRSGRLARAGLIVCFGIIQVDGHPAFYRRVRSPPKCQRWGGQERGRQTRECSLDHLGKIDDSVWFDPFAGKKRLNARYAWAQTAGSPRTNFRV